MKAQPAKKWLQYWHGKRIKHLDSAPKLGPRRYSLIHVREIARKTLQTQEITRVPNFKAIGKFLKRCRYVPDEEQFGTSDYWQTPDQFEKTRKGDCEDFALWAWRQLLELGEEARFTYGYQGLDGHAWVTVYRDSEPFIFEATQRPGWFGTIPLIPAREQPEYKPKVSIDKNLKFYMHHER